MTNNTLYRQTGDIEGGSKWMTRMTNNTPYRQTGDIEGGSIKVL